MLSGLCWRYDNGVQEAIKRVLDGAIGDIVAIQETYMRSAYRLIERRPEDTELQYQFRNWYHFNWLCGDDVPQSLLHSMDKGQWALGEVAPVKAFGQGGRSSCFGNIYGDVFDHSSIVYEYANGVRMYANVRAQTGCYGEVTDTIHGTKGRCYLPRKCTIEGEKNWQYDGPKSNMYDNEHVALFQAIRSGKTLNCGNYMVTSTMMSIMGADGVLHGPADDLGTGHELEVYGRPGRQWLGHGSAHQARCQRHLPDPRTRHHQARLNRFNTFPRSGLGVSCQSMGAMSTLGMAPILIGIGSGLQE